MKAIGLVVVLLACGAEVEEPQMNPGMLGAWTGQSTTTSGFAIVPHPSTLTVKADGPRVSVAGLCPDGFGSVFNALGEGDAATWYGPSLACSAVRVGDCAPVVVTYTGLTVRLTPNGLEVNASGTVSGCDVTGSMAETFIGSR